MADNSVVA